MTEPAHLKYGPSGAHRWLICTDAPNAEANYPNEVTEASDEGTAAHWLLEQCLRAGKHCRQWVDEDHAASHGYVIPAGTGANPEYEDQGTVWEWPITGEMIEAVQLAIDTVEKHSKKRGTRLFIEERVRVQETYGLREPVGGTADVIMYLPKSKTLIVLDFKYGKGHMVEVDKSPLPEVPFNPQMGLYGLAGMVELERLIGEKRMVKTIELVVVQPRMHHKKGPVRRKKLDPFSLMSLEAAMIGAVNGEPVRVPGEEQCAFCRAKPDCPAHHLWRGEQAASAFDAEVQEPSNIPAPSQAPARAELPAEQGTALDQLITRPATALKARELAIARRILPTLKKWAGEVEAEVKQRLLNDIDIPGARLAAGKSSRAFGGAPEEIATAVDELLLMGYSEEDVYEPRTLKSVAQIEKAVGRSTFAKTTLAKLVAKTAGGPTVVDEDSDKPPYLKAEGLQAEAPPIESDLL